MLPRMADGDAAVDDPTLVDALEQLRRVPTDAARPEAVAKQRARDAWTARERIDALVDPESFREYGLLAKPARPDLTGPADGIVTGLARVRDRPIAIASYDYTVLGGQPGQRQQHQDRPDAATGRGARTPVRRLRRGRWPQGTGGGPSLTRRRRGDVPDAGSPLRPSADGVRRAGTCVRWARDPGRAVRLRSRDAERGDRHGRSAAGRGGPRRTVDAGADRRSEHPRGLRRGGGGRRRRAGHGRVDLGLPFLLRGPLRAECAGGAGSRCATWCPRTRGGRTTSDR